jgi:hypothetical protein
LQSCRFGFSEEIEELQLCTQDGIYARQGKNDDKNYKKI